MNAPEIARRAEAAGVRDGDGARPHALPVLRRAADWAAIARGQAGGGDPGDRQRRHRRRRRRARALARSGADGVMVGRGARGRPWLIGADRGRARRAAGAGAPGAGGARLRPLRRHVGFYGRDLGVRMARKHLGWYLDGVPGGRCAPAAGDDRPRRGARRAGARPRRPADGGGRMIGAAASRRCGAPSPIRRWWSMPTMRSSRPTRRRRASAAPRCGRWPAGRSASSSAATARCSTSSGRRGATASRWRSTTSWSAGPSSRRSCRTCMRRRCTTATARS